MILHRDGLVELQYDVATDILSVCWPDIKLATVPELQFSISKLVETLRHYDIRNLFIDARENVEQVTDEEYRTINTRFAESLLTTQLQKIARVGYPNPTRQEIVEGIATEYLQKSGGRIAYLEFYDTPSAMAWLSAK